MSNWHQVLNQYWFSDERWASKLAVPAGNRVTETGMTPFQAVSGNNAYGTALLIMDTADAVGLYSRAVQYNIYKIFVTDVGHTTVYRVRICYGTTTAADAVTAGQYAETIFRTPDIVYDNWLIELRMVRVLSAWKSWLQVWNATNLSPVDFYTGLRFFET